MNDFWLSHIPAFIGKIETPCYVSSFAPVERALSKLEFLNQKITIRHWFSLKTNPNKRILLEWKELGHGVEVVSEFEFQATLDAGFEPGRILLNGPAKHHWLPRHAIDGINVHIDSWSEFQGLKEAILPRGWKLGLRLHMDNELDPDEPEHHSQFGLEKEEFKAVLEECRALGIPVRGLHFHLRTNVPQPGLYLESIQEALAVCAQSGLEPEYLDMGGGLPAQDGEHPQEDFDFDYSALEAVVEHLRQHAPWVRELWMENGRFMLASASILAIKVLDIKFKRGMRYLICDSGRTNNALVSDWETHDFATFPPREHKNMIPTTVCGNTCMSFDRLFRAELPADVRVGDRIIWFNAGAYHIPWETRFSGGLCNVYHLAEDGTIELTRKKESFKDWWDDWK